MTRRPFLAGNWKMNLSPTAAGDLASAMVDELSAATDHVDIALFPTAVSLSATLEVTAGSAIRVGPQWVSAAASGAFTGQNSPTTCREMGATIALAGHSEVRQYLQSTDAGIGTSLVAALDAGMLGMLCVGETLAQRDAEQAVETVCSQLAGALADLPADRMSGISIAYEPVWAIGTGRTATPEMAQEMHAAIRSWLRERFGGWAADQTRILYGGSVKPHNAGELLAQPDIDGALVGGASMKLADFAAIVKAAL